MDTQKLKVFAARLRAHLEHHNLILKHGQTLDLIAAVPGLRNWPEVNAFPARVSTAMWDLGSADRLAKRIAKQHALILPADELHRALEPAVTGTLKVWPDGPPPGVYVTISQAAIDAAIAKYEAATDGAPLYAERAGRSSDAAIDLGEYGLFSGGMNRLPSGTLVVVGPLPLTQESWSDNKDRLNVAANLAYSSSLRIAVLVETPLPENLHSDIDLLLRPDDEGLDSEAVDTLGIVAKSGDLQVMRPFVRERARPPAQQHFATAQRLPPVLEDALKQAVVKRPYGVVVVGISPSHEPRKALLEAVLPLTEYAGPAVRIQPTFSSGYGKDDTPLSPHFQGLPIFPSIESAHAHGYRRMVIESSYHRGLNAMEKHATDTCFLITSYSTEVAGAWMEATLPYQEWRDDAEAIIALLCMAEIETKKETYVVCDAFIAGAPPFPGGERFGEFMDYLEAHRVVRWQDQLDALLLGKKVTLAAAKRALRRHNVEAYLGSKSMQV